MAPGEDKAWDRVWDIKRQFEKKYPPGQYGKYTCGISKVYLQTAEEPEGESKDYCIRIGLLNPFPANLKFPENYQGVRVFVGVNKPVTDQ